MKYRSKSELVASIELEHRRFLELADSVSSPRYTEPGVWGDDWTIKDLFAHLTAWEQLFLEWHGQGLLGRIPDMPARGFTWRDTPALNHRIWEEHRDTPWPEVRAEFHASFAAVLDLTRSLSEEELFTPGHFAWTRGNPLVTYLGANTASHYRTATKMLKRWLTADAKKTPRT